MTTTTAPHYAATPKQMRYVTALAAKRQWDPSHPDAATLEGLVDGRIRGMEKWLASDLIGYLLDQPLTTAAQQYEDAPKVAEPGYYLRDDVVYFIKWNQARTGTYAKRMRITGGRGSWQYAPGVGRCIAAEGLTALTVADAARLGHLHGVCVVCGRALSDPESVARGMGPVCAKRVAESHTAISRASAKDTPEVPEPHVSTEGNQFADITDLSFLEAEMEWAASGEDAVAFDATPEEADAMFAKALRDYEERLAQLRGY